MLATTSLPSVGDWVIITTVVAMTACFITAIRAFGVMVGRANDSKETGITLINALFTRAIDVMLLAMVLGTVVILGMAKAIEATGLVAIISATVGFVVGTQKPRLIGTLKDQSPAQKQSAKDNSSSTPPPSGA